MRLRHRTIIEGLIGFCAVVLLAGCEREERQFRELPAATARANSEVLSTLQPGPRIPEPEVRDPYVGNAQGIAEGQRLFQWMNCVGCHANGGGGMGPPLMDDKWIYGGDPENVFATIVEGRPNGMPSFRGKLTENQVWQLVAYVRSMSGMASKAATPSRADSLRATDPSNLQTPDPPKSQAAEHLP